MNSIITSVLLLFTFRQISGAGVESSYITGFPNPQNTHIPIYHDKKPSLASIQAPVPRRAYRVLTDEYGKKWITRIILQNGEMHHMPMALYTQADSANLLQTSDASLLHLAAGDGHLNLVKGCLNHGALIESLDSLGFTALECAVTSSRSHVVKYLISRGARFADTNAFHWAMMVNDKVVAEMLIAECIRHGLPFGSATHPFIHRAVEFGRLPFVQLLLDSGADPSSVDAFGSTPLCIANKFNHIEIARLLTERGAVLEAKEPEMTIRPCEMAEEPREMKMEPVELKRDASSDKAPGTTRSGRSNATTLLKKYNDFAIDEDNHNDPSLSDSPVSGKKRKKSPTKSTVRKEAKNSQAFTHALFSASQRSENSPTACTDAASTDSSSNDSSSKPKKRKL